MEKGVFVKEIGFGPVEGVFLLEQATKGTTRNGDPFWSLTLADVSGHISAKIWSPMAAEISGLETGSFVRVAGKAKAYQDSLQVTVDRIERLSQRDVDRLDMEDFLPPPPVDVDALLDELRRMAAREFVNPAWRAFIGSIFKDERIFADYRSRPAATKVHQSHVGGLLDHSLGVARACLAFADLYPELDRQLLLAGALLHDIGKTREYSGGPVPEQTAEGGLEGHIFLGLELIAPHLEASGLDEVMRMQLRHLILSHHGALEFGSPVLPQMAEAWALHFADNMDAKMAVFRENLGDTEPGTRTQGKVFPLGCRLFRTLPTPGGATPPAEGGDEGCS